jgi:DNA-binding transcriptional ArsR family regulator
MIHPMENNPHRQPGADQLDSVFAALGDATRRDILRRLLEADAPVNAVAKPYGITLAAVSKHLSILARAGLIVQEKRGREKWCRLDPDAIAPAAIWMQAFGHLLPDDFDALEAQIADVLGQDCET